MIVNTPDGPVNFPDSMGTDDIQNVLRQKYGFQGGGQSAPAPDGPATATPPTPSPGSTSAPISPSAPGAVGQQRGGGWFTGGDQPAWLNQNATPSLGQTSALEKPADASWNDFMLAHMAEAGKGVGQIGQSADDYVRAATNTFGLGDRFAAGMSNLTGIGGGDLAAQRDQTAAANARLGPAGRVAANITGYGPFAAQGIAGGLGGGVLGTVGEGVAAGGLGAAGHDEPIAPGVLTGGVGGLVGGVGSKALGGIANKITGGPDVNAAAGDITSSLKDTRDAAYDKMKGVFYKPDDLLDHLDQTKADIYASDPGGDLVGAAPRSMAALNSLYTRTADTIANPTQTAHGILTTIDKLNDIQRSPGGPENDIAPIIKDRLNNFLQTANPVNPDLGPGDASNMLAAAKAAHQQFANARDLQQAAQSLRGFGQSPTGWAQNTAEAFHPDPNSPAYKALSNIANSGGAPGGQSGYTVTHGVVHPIVEGLALAALPPAVAPAAAAAATFMGIKPLLSKAMGAGSTASQLNSIYKAYPTLTGRQFTPPTGPDPGAALRALILGNAAAR